MSDNNTYIAAVTAADTKLLSLNNGQSVTISASGLAGAEVIDVQVLQGTVYASVGEELTVAEPAKILDGPGQYQISKGVTVGVVGVYIDG